MIVNNKYIADNTQNQRLFKNEYWQYPNQSFLKTNVNHNQPKSIIAKNKHQCWENAK